MAGGNSLEGREQKKGIAVNNLYTMGGLLFMNAVAPDCDHSAS